MTHRQLISGLKKLSESELLERFEVWVSKYYVPGRGCHGPSYFTMDNFLKQEEKFYPTDGRAPRVSLATRAARRTLAPKRRSERLRLREASEPQASPSNLEQ